MKSLSQSSAEPPGVVGAGESGPPELSLGGAGQIFAPIWDRGVDPCTTKFSTGGGCC